MRSPLTGVVFAPELTHRHEALLPLLIGATVADAVSILVLRRSVLTEKIARRGVHLTREYSVDPLEMLFVEDVMSTLPVVDRDDHSRAIGVTLEQLVQGRLRDLHEERHSERALQPRDLIGLGRGSITEETVG